MEIQNVTVNLWYYDLSIKVGITLSRPGFKHKNEAMNIKEKRILLNASIFRQYKQLNEYI